MTYLTEKYFSTKFSFKAFFQFFIDVYYSKKLTELFSFLIWELKYQIGYYKKSKILKFSNGSSLHYLTDIKNITIKSNSFSGLECKYDWKLISANKDVTFFGCTYSEPSILYCFSSDEIPFKCHSFNYDIESLFIDKSDNIFICAGGVLYKSRERGSVFKEVLHFSFPECYFRQEAITENIKGDLFIGEYANKKNGKKWEFTGFIYHSINKGDTWVKIDLLEKHGVNKHIHILRWIDVIQALILTDGDNKKGIWVNKSPNQFDKASSITQNGWQKINKLHIQKGGYTGIAEINNQIILGTDYNGGSNFIVSTNNLQQFNSRIIPDPYRRAIIRRIVVRLDKNQNQEIWVNTFFNHSKKVKSLLMCSTNNGNTWQKVIEYDGTQYEIDIIGDSFNFKDKLFILIQDRTKDLATTFCISNG